MKIEYLIEKYVKLIYKICFDMLSSPEEAEDICQETYVSLYINLDKYKSLDDNEYKNLICKIALNKCRDYLRSKHRKKEEFLDDVVIQIGDLKQSNKLEDLLLQTEKSKIVQNTIYTLKEPYKTLIYEYYINEKSLDELAIKMNTSKGTIKTQLYRGKEILKKKFEKIRGDFYE